MAKKTPTKFGKVLRILRIERDELLVEMANKLEISISYLSMMENGLRDVPDTFLAKLAWAYELTDEQIELLHTALKEDRAAEVVHKSIAFGINEGIINGAISLSQMGAENGVVAYTEMGRNIPKHQNLKIRRTSNE